ncbi:MAG: hypothetical protein K8H84_07290 [Sulfuricella denitrificans]|nr:hypothetical protein [Sulfuricella denitrificans]
MSAKKKLRKLTEAHRELAARTEALAQVAKVVYPLIGMTHPGIAKRLITQIYDATNDHMERRGFDDEYQQWVRSAMDELCELILMAANKCEAHQS